MYKYETNNDARYVPLSVLPGRSIDERLTTNACVYAFFFSIRLILQHSSDKSK